MPLIGAKITNSPIIRKFCELLFAHVYANKCNISQFVFSAQCLIIYINRIPKEFMTETEQKLKEGLRRQAPKAQWLYGRICAGIVTQYLLSCGSAARDAIRDAP